MTGLLRVLLVDDERLAIERLRVLLSALPAIEVVGATRSGQEALELVKQLVPDLCLLDIGMPGVDGITLARQLAGLSSPPCVVFVTAFDSFAVAAFELEAVDYLVKPVEPARLAQALDRVRARPERLRCSEPANRIVDFWASDQRGLVRIAAQDVERITAERDYMRLHVGRRSWLINDSLTRLEQHLDPDLFVRVHRSAIVRRDFITGFRHDESGWTACLSDGGEQKVGRAYAENARKLARLKRFRA